MPYKDKEKKRAYSRERSRRLREEKPEEMAASSRVASLAWYRRNREKVLAKYSPEKARGYVLRRYGMSLDEEVALFEAQGRCCAACGSDKPGCVKGWHLDHDHDTMKARGILCFWCNTALGRLGDRADAVRENIAKILKYLGSVSDPSGTSSS